MKRLHKVFSGFLLLCTVTAAAETALVENVSFTDLPRLIKERNQNVSGAKQFVSSAESQTGHLVRSYLPTLRTSVGGEYFQTGPYRPQRNPYGEASASINLFRGGRDLLEENAREAQVQVAKSNSDKTYLSELTDARNTYWEIVFTQEMITILKQALEKNEQNLTAANRRIQRGLGAETDRLEFQIYRSQLEEEIESFTHALKLVQIRFSAMIGFPQQTQFKTMTKIEHEHDESISATKYDANNHPDVVFAKANHENFNFQKGQDSRWWTPSLDVYGGYLLYTLRDRDYLVQRDRYDWVVGAKLTIEIFDGFKSVANANALAHQAQGYELQAEQRLKTVNAGVEVAKEDLKHDHELIHRSEERIDQGKKYLSRTLDEYNRGVKNSIDVLVAIQKYIGFERQYAERRRDYKVTKDRLLALIGE